METDFFIVDINRDNTRDKVEITSTLISSYIIKIT